MTNLVFNEFFNISIIFFKNTNSFKNGPSVWFGGTDFKFAYYNDSFTTVHSSSTYAINNWHHVVLTIGSDRDGVLYVNGSSALTFSGALITSVFS